VDLTPYVNPVIAMGRIINSGTNNLVGSNVTDNGGGSYTVALTTSPTPSDYVVQLSVNSTVTNVRTIQITIQNPANFNVQIFDETGAQADSDWNYTVITF